METRKLLLVSVFHDAAAKRYDKPSFLTQFSFHKCLKAISLMLHRLNHKVVIFISQNKNINILVVRCLVPYSIKLSMLRKSRLT